IAFIPTGSSTSTESFCFCCGFAAFLSEACFISAPPGPAWAVLSEAPAGFFLLPPICQSLCSFACSPLIIIQINFKRTRCRAGVPLDFKPVIETFEQMEQTSSRLALTDYLVHLLKKTPPEIIDKVTYLIQGKLYPDYEGIELGIAEKMVIRAIANSSGRNTSEIESVYQKTGDLGDAAREVMKSKSQSTLFSEPMTVERVYSTFDKIARTIGAGSQETKVRLISSLLNDATAEEGRYIIKFAMGQLRLGIADYTVLDALAIAFTGDKANRQM